MTARPPPLTSSTTLEGEEPLVGVNAMPLVAVTSVKRIALFESSLGGVDALPTLANPSDAHANEARANEARANEAETARER